jgi:asparagine synthase (glutamine-hydrolysing)
LPPAHTLQCQDGNLNVARYWRLPEARVAREFRREEECLEQFRDVFDTAVSDRLRGESAGILLSGGLDSPAVAASARRVLARRNSAFDFRAHCIVHDSLIPHDERHYAGLVAQALDIPIRFMLADNCRLYDNYDDPRFRTAEPAHFPMGFRNVDPYIEIEKFSRTALTGYGGDPTLGSYLSGHFRRLFQERRLGRMISDAVGFLGAEGRFSRLYLSNRLRRWFGRAGTPQIPGWLNPDFVRRAQLRDRWQAVLSEDTNHSVRPEAYSNVSASDWTYILEGCDPAIIGFNVETGHPFFDLRVLDFLLALPALPWCSDKELLRQIDRGVVPDAVRLRKKSPLQQDPILALLQSPEASWVDTFEAVPELHEFVDRNRVPRCFQATDPELTWSAMKPLSLNFWLQRCAIGEPERQKGAGSREAVLAAS